MTGNELSAVDFRAALEARLAAAAKAGRPFVDVRSGDLHREVGAYPGHQHRMPTCCSAMRSAMRAGDTEVAAPPKGNGATLTIRYRLPR